GEPVSGAWPVEDARGGLRCEIVQVLYCRRSAGRFFRSYLVRRAAIPVGTRARAPRAIERVVLQDEAKAELAHDVVDPCHLLIVEWVDREVRDDNRAARSIRSDGGVASRIEAALVGEQDKRGTNQTAYDPGRVIYCL